VILLTPNGLAKTITELVYFMVWILDRKENTEDERNDMEKRIELDMAQILPRFWALSWMVVVI
jgi:hypothetical protein